MRRPVVVPGRGAFLLARLRVRRREVLWWATAITLAGITITVVGGAREQADAAGSRWGRATNVLVAAEPIEVGQQLGAGDIRATEWPTSLVPSDAVTSGAEGRIAIASLNAGEVLVDSRLAPDGLTGAAALLPPDTRALAVPDVAGGLALRPGDRVDVLVVVDPFELSTGDGGGSAQQAQVVAAGATVVAVADDSTTVAVPRADVPEVAAALGQGVVTLALASPIEAARPTRPPEP